MDMSSLSHVLLLSTTIKELVFWKLAAEKCASLGSYEISDIETFSSVMEVFCDQNTFQYFHGWMSEIEGGFILCDSYKCWEILLTTVKDRLGFQED